MKQSNVQHCYADSMSVTWAGATNTLFVLERAVTHALAEQYNISHAAEGNLQGISVAQLCEIG